MKYMREQRQRFERLVNDSVGLAYVPPFNSFSSLIIDVRGMSIRLIDRLRVRIDSGRIGSS